MKATIVSTDAVVTVKDPEGRPAHARVWEGTSEHGVPFTAYITLVQVHKSQDQSQFERELTEHKMPSADTLLAIDARFIL